MFSWRETSAVADRGFTMRSGGVSRGRYASLNLGAHVGDEPAAVAENRARLAASMDRPVVYMEQCHGGDIAVVEAVPTEPPRCDGLVAVEPGLALAVLVADCVPVLLASAEGVVSAVHAGRPGVLAGVVPHAVAAMRDLGAIEIDAVVGPSVCSRCYEVPEQMRQVVAETQPVAAAVSWTGTPAVDVGAAVVAQLRDAGVVTRWLPGCTRESRDLFSYRRDGSTGRFAGVVARVWS
ncbi:MAG: polyphenol oxidase family protein [Dermatophilaceae bacterium]